MKQRDLLEEAKAAPDKRPLDVHLETIWELQRKGYSLREIAEFFKERGIETDHVAIYRLIIEGNPFLDHRDGRVLIWDQEYESRKGRPLRPFSAGLYITIKEKLRIIQAENPERVASTWCEAQFLLSDVPNFCWIEQVAKNLDITWNRKNPCYLQQRFGTEVKFEGNVMALVCQTFNLKTEVRKLAKSVQKATEFFMQDKQWLARRQQMEAERAAKIPELLVIPPGESKEDAIEEYLEWHRKYDERLAKEFKEIPVHWE